MNLEDNTTCYECPFVKIVPADSKARLFDCNDLVNVYCIRFRKLVETNLRIHEIKDVQKPKWCNIKL